MILAIGTIKAPAITNGKIIVFIIKVGCTRLISVKNSFAIVQIKLYAQNRAKFATKAPIIPITNPSRINGHRINQSVAPTDFIILISHLLENTIILISFTIKSNERGGSIIKTATPTYLKIVTACLLIIKIVAEFLLSNIIYNKNNPTIKKVADILITEPIVSVTFRFKLFIASKKKIFKCINLHNHVSPYFCPNSLIKKFFLFFIF